jgi:hypothetical protein
MKGLKNGFGTFKFTNGNRMRCTFVDGKAHGKGEVWIKKTRSKEPAE